MPFRRSGDRPLSPRSLSQTLSSIRAFHRWLDRRCGVANDALALVRGPRVKPGAPRPVSRPHVVKVSFTQMGQCAALVLRRW